MADLSNRTIKFPRTLKGVKVTYCGKPSVPAAEAEEEARLAYERGKADAHAAIAEQMDTLRTEMETRQDELLKSLQEQYEKSMIQLAQRVPKLVALSAKRVIDSIEIQAHHVESIVDKVLSEAPEGKNVKIRLHPEDLRLLRSLNKAEKSSAVADPAAESVDFAQALSGLFGGGSEGGDGLSLRYPGIRFEEDDSLSRGDCFVESRFGTLDGSVRTRLRALEGED